ncbi:MAG: methylglyoxal synthase [Bacteriovoracaceae bacterium]|jgi:methylglyoxal synthase
MKSQKNIALVAHDHKKAELMEWIKIHKDELVQHKLFATGTTGVKIEKELGIEVYKYKSGPIGGDQQIGAAIVGQKIDILFFFWDPLASQPHDPDVKALLRVAALWDTIVACNRSSADFIIKSSLIDKEYKRNLTSINKYTKERQLEN